MKALAIKDLCYSRNLKLLSSCTFERIFKYHCQCKSLIAQAFILLLILTTYLTAVLYGIMGFLSLNLQSLNVIKFFVFTLFS